MAFVTLEEFFENYRIKNQQQPNETVLNRGLMRLKRETRELKSLVDILVGNELIPWNSNKIYEKDEYVSHNDLIYKSLIDRNFNIEPFSTDTDNWVLVSLNGGASGGGSVIKYKTFIAEEDQTIYVTPFNIDSTPMVFIDGALLEADRYTVLNNTTIQLNEASQLNDSVTVIAGVTYDTSLVIAKERFVATEGQYLFEPTFVIKTPSVFIDGVLIDETEYTWSNTSIDLNDPLTEGQIVVIGNGSVLGAEIYSVQNTDELLSFKRDISDSYSITEIDDLLTPKATYTYVDDEIDIIDSAKADKATTIDGYSIEDAYTKTEVDSLLVGKLSTTLYLDKIVLQKIKNVDGSGSGLDADLLDGLDSGVFLRNDIQDDKFYNFSIQNSSDITVETPILTAQLLFDVESEDAPKILFREFDEVGNVIAENTAYHTGNTGNVMIIKEGYFKGTWNPTLDATFGIADYNNYNWFVNITPTLIGLEHDYNIDAAAGHTPYTGFDTNVAWDENQSEYHYGYIQGNIVKLQSIHRNGSQVIDLPAKYQLTGVLKTFSTYEWVNQ